MGFEVGIDKFLNEQEKKLKCGNFIIHLQNLKLLRSEQ